MAQEKGANHPPHFESSSLKDVIISDVSTFEALELNREALHSELTAEEARALRWKIDLRLMPLLCITYALQAIDKNTLSYAAVFGIREETNLQGTDYSWISAIFYLGYLVAEFPSNLLLQRLPINRVMSATVSFCSDFTLHFFDAKFLTNIGNPLGGGPDVSRCCSIVC